MDHPGRPLSAFLWPCIACNKASPVTRDLTERKQAQEQLANAIALLEQTARTGHRSREVASRWSTNGSPPILHAGFLDKSRMSGYPDTVVRIIEPARRHGITDENILHALRNAIEEWQLRDDFTILVGPDTAGNLLEIGVADLEEEWPVVIHAMPCRSQYLPRT